MAGRQEAEPFQVCKRMSYVCSARRVSASAKKASASLFVK